MSDPKGNTAQSHPIPSQAAPGGPLTLTCSGLCLGKLNPVDSTTWARLPLSASWARAMEGLSEREQREPQCSPLPLPCWQLGRSRFLHMWPQLLQVTYEGSGFCCIPIRVPALPWSFPSWVRNGTPRWPQMTTPKSLSL